MVQIKAVCGISGSRFVECAALSEVSQIKAVYRFLGPLRADLLRKSVERLYSFDVLLGSAKKARVSGVSRTHVPPRPRRRQSNIKASTDFRGARVRMDFFGSVGPCQQISGFPRSLRARVVKYQGSTEFRSMSAVVCRSSARLPKSLRNKGAQQIFGACPR